MDLSPWRSTLLCAAMVLFACQQGDGVAAGPAVVQQGMVHEPSLRQVIDSLAIPEDSVRIVVHKAERRLVVLAGTRILRAYPCVLGTNPVGDKMQEGDRRTPEGHFLFRDKYPHAKWNKFIWIDHPNAEGRERFDRRKAEGLIPANARIGGELGIHGVPPGKDAWITDGVDWTWGCIALRNADLDEVYGVVQVQHTRLEILP
jgi:murein L,D-transpeptidase YafK